MSERYFCHYIFPEDNDVVFVGHASWITRHDNPTPVLGPYLCDAAEVNQRFDELEADLKRCRCEALAAINKLSCPRGKSDAKP